VAISRIDRRIAAQHNAEQVVEQVSAVPIWPMDCTIVSQSRVLDNWLPSYNMRHKHRQARILAQVRSHSIICSRSKVSAAGMICALS